MLFPKSFKTEKVSLKDDININVTYGGEGTQALVLLHGFPQTHTMWHCVASQLSKKYFLICPDLRGYGDSSKPKGLENHENYSKKIMANDIISVVKLLGFEKFYLCGHDRGARVAYRICLDYPENVLKVCVMDITPTYHMFKNTDQNFATGYYHWFFLIQPNNLPETMIGANPRYYLEEKLRRWSAKGAHFVKEAVDEYVRCYDEDGIHSSCEDYRAAATIDMIDDEKDRDKKISTPLLVLWGSKGFVNRTYDVINIWKEYAQFVEGKTLDCGHFLPEEKPQEVITELEQFFK